MWVTTKDGRQVNTDWFDKDRQIEESKKEADKKNAEEKKVKNNPAFDKAVAKIPDAKEVWRIDREGFAVGITNGGDVFVGTGILGGTDYYKDTPENRKKAEDYWKANSFAREIRR